MRFEKTGHLSDEAATDLVESLDDVGAWFDPDAVLHD
jgi:hypothetical protein